MRKQPAITEATRKKFTDKFCELYEKKPIDRITVREITESLHYNRSTFYEYFTDIYDLRDQLNDELTDHLVSIMKKALKSDLKGDEFFIVFRELINTQDHYARVLLFNKHDSSFVDRAVERVMPLMQEVFGVEPTNKRAEYALRYHISGMMQLIRSIDRAEHNSTELAMAVRMILQNGVLAAVME